MHAWPSQPMKLKPQMIKIVPAFITVAVMCHPLQAQTQPVAFVNVNVVPMDAERVLSQRTVIVKGGSIVAIGPSRTTSIPKGARRIDGRSKFLMPGLADMHVHMRVGPMGASSVPELVAYVANGVTTVRNMWGTKDVLSLRREIEVGNAIGPRIFTTGPLTDGNPPVRPGSRVVETSEQANSAVRSDKEEGYDALKVYDALSPDTYRALLAGAHQIGLPVYGHVPDAVRLDEALVLRQKSIEHFEGYRFALQRDDSPVMGQRTIKNMDYIDWGKIPTVVEATLKSGTWNCPTLVTSSIPDASSPEDLRRMTLKPYLKYLPASVTASWTMGAQRRIDNQRSAEDIARFRKRLELNLKLVKLLSDAGAGLLAGSDGPRNFVAPGFSLHEELRLFVDAGLTPYQALRTATIGPAVFLGREGEFGTVARGQRADLLLLEANPLQDIRNTSRRVGVMLRGRWFTEADLSQRMEQEARRAAKQ